MSLSVKISRLLCIGVDRETANLSKAARIVNSLLAGYNH